jgi:hypothetical protein
MCFAGGGAREPNEGHYGDDDGDHGPDQPDAWQSGENPDVPEFCSLYLLHFLLTKVTGS